MTSATFEWPEPPAARFIANLKRVCGDDAVVLDIGPGRSGRHSRVVEDSGFRLVSVDISHACRAHYHADIHDMVFPESSFDAILDIKTLCQDPNPPYKRIHSWLKPLGTLFSMVPGEEHIANPEAWDIKHHAAYEYPYMRMATEKDIKEMLCDFSAVGLYKYTMPCRVEHGVKYLYSWCVEAQK